MYRKNEFLFANLHTKLINLQKRKINMSELVKVHCVNIDKVKEFPMGTSLIEMSKTIGLNNKYPIIGARVNNALKELSYRVYNQKYIEFIDITDIDGKRMYQRSLSFVLMKAVRDVFPKSQLKIEHSISQGFYCEVDKEPELKPEEVLKIAERMRKIIDKDIPFRRDQIPTFDAIKIYEKNGLIEKANLFKSRPTLFTSVYYLEDRIDYFYGYLVPSTGYLKVFDLIPYYQGMLLRFPQQSNPLELGDVIEQKKMFDIFQEYKDWGEILGISNIGTINTMIKEGKAGELIKLSEALHEKKVSQIADLIHKKGTVKLVLISGPSSSGKTTFSKRLDIQLKVLGIKSMPLSMDNFFVDREKTPRDEKGEFDFETIEAIDLELFKKVMLSLIEGKPTQIPIFNFKEGKKEFKENSFVTLTEDGVLIVEGIHALNPKVSDVIASKYLYKIYVSALTQIGIDSHNRIPTTDNRLIRRIVRDYQYRNYSCENTLKRWASVRAGEDKNIFPYQEEADIMFNTALIYELAILKRYIEPLLKKVPETIREYSEAKRLLKFLSYFEEINAKYELEIPPTSILREFLYGSSFKY